MFFTKEDYQKIAQYLKSMGVRDTDIQQLNTAQYPLTGDETFVLVKNGINVRVTLNHIYQHFPEFAEIMQEALKTAYIDIFNVTNYIIQQNDGNGQLTLEQAIQSVPIGIRRIGLYITFYNTNNEWETYQMVGTSVTNDWNVEYFVNHHKDLQSQIEDINNSKATLTLTAYPTDTFDAENNSRQAQLTLVSSRETSTLKILKGTTIIKSGNKTTTISENVNPVKTTVYAGEATFGSVVVTTSIKIYVVHKIKYYAGQSYDESSASSRLAKTPDGTYSITIPEGGGYIYFYIPTDLGLKATYELLVALKEETPTPIDMQKEHSDSNGILWRSEASYDPGNFQFTVKVN